MKGYEVKIVSTNKELSAKERVAVKDTTNAIALDDVTKEGSATITPDYYVELQVHNEKSEDKDYTKFIIVDENGTKYVTGSESFISSFLNIVEEMGDSDEEYQISAYRMPSKNYKGKEFLTCSIK